MKAMIKGWKNWVVVVLLLYGLFGFCCWILWASHGHSLPTWKECPAIPKKPSLNQRAKARAEAEYHCTKVKIEASSSKIIRLNVCGKLRWYDCSGYSCSEVKPKDARTWALSKPDGTWAFTGCKNYPGKRMIGKVCTFIVRNSDCWVCERRYLP